LRKPESGTEEGVGSSSLRARLEDAVEEETNPREQVQLRWTARRVVKTLKGILFVRE